LQFYRAVVQLGLARWCGVTRHEVHCILLRWYAELSAVTTMVNCWASICRLASRVRCGSCFQSENAVNQPVEYIAKAMLRSESSLRASRGAGLGLGVGKVAFSWSSAFGSATVFCGKTVSKETARVAMYKTAHDPYEDDYL
jgi:hypothetical protein